MTILKKRLLLLAMIIIAAIVTVKGIRVYNMKLKDYYTNCRTAFEIPDLSKGFIPQGISYDQTQDLFFLTGYMGSFKASPIYVINAKTGEHINTIRMLTEEGKPFRGHAGGLSVCGDRVYVAGSTKSCIYRFTIAELLDGEPEIRLDTDRTISLENPEDKVKVSFTSADDSLLYAGEFHRGVLFHTHRSHSTATADGTQKAYLTGLRIDEDGTAVPECVYSIPDGIQGACFADGYLFLTQSHGLLHGNVLSYALEELESDGSRRVLGREVPCFILTKSNAKKITRIPPMPEEVTAAGDELYFVHEAAANLYRFGRTMDLDQVIAVPIDYFK